jgi:hypothetical protein
MARNRPSKSDLIIAVETLQRDYDFLRRLHDQAAADVRRLAQFAGAAEKLLREAELYSPRFAAEHRAELARLRASVNGEGVQVGDNKGVPPECFRFLEGEAGEW